MNRCIHGVFLLLILAATARAQDQTQAVHRLLDDIERAWSEHDINALRGYCAEEGMLAIFSRPGNPEGAGLLNREVALALIEQRWTDVRAHRFLERQINVRGPIAWIHATVVNELADRKTPPARVLNLAVHVNGQWQMALSMPELFRVAVTVNKIMPEGQAAKLGIQVGDIVERYGGRAMTFTADLVAATDPQRMDSPTTGSVPLVIRRANRSLILHAGPGRLGIQAVDVLVPTPHAMLFDVDQPHPCRKVSQEVLAACVAGDAEAVMSHVAEDFIVADPSVGDGTVVMRDRASFGARLGEQLGQIGQVIDLTEANAVRPREIAIEDVAVATSRFEARKREDGSDISYPSILEVYIRQEDQWRMATILPLRAEAELPDLDPAKAE